MDLEFPKPEIETGSDLSFVFITLYNAEKQNLGKDRLFTFNKRKRRQILLQE
jgi:hypothetical protein